MEIRYLGSLPSGSAVKVYTLTNGLLTLEVIDRGCAIRSLKFDDVDTVRGFDTLEDYLADDSHQGAIIGRVANRVANEKQYPVQQAHLPTTLVPKIGNTRIYDF